MAKFDFVKAAAAGYRYVWRERQAILSLAGIPIAIKIGSFAFILLMGMQQNFFRQGLVLLPAYFLEGFVIALIIRMAIFGENYANVFNRSTRPEKLPEHVRTAVMASSVVYLITKLVASFFAGSMKAARENQVSPDVLPQPVPEPSLMPLTIMIVLFLIWFLRFLWLYVPVAMGVPAKKFLQAIQGYMSSIYLLALWLITTVPLMTIFTGLLKLFIIMLGNESASYVIAVFVTQAFIEMGIMVISGVAMAYAVKMIMDGAPRKPGLF